MELNFGVSKNARRLSDGKELVGFFRVGLDVPFAHLLLSDAEEVLKS